MTPKAIKQDLKYILSKMKNFQERFLEIQKFSHVEEFEEVGVEIDNLQMKLKI